MGYGASALNYLLIRTFQCPLLAILRTLHFDHAGQGARGSSLRPVLPVWIRFRLNGFDKRAHAPFGVVRGRGIPTVPLNPRA